MGLRIKHLLWTLEDPSWYPQQPSESYSPHATERGDRWIPWAYWEASLAKTVRSKCIDRMNNVNNIGMGTYDQQ